MFIAYLQQTYRNFGQLKSIMEKRITMQDPSGETIDTAHLVATADCYISSSAVPSIWGGWAGDLITGLKDAQAYNITVEKTLGNQNYSCSYEDLRTDADAALLGNMMITGKTFSKALDDYYRSMYRARYYSLRTNSIKSSSKSDLNNKVYNVISNIPTQLAFKVILNNDIKKAGVKWFLELLYTKYQ